MEPLSDKHLAITVVDFFRDPQIHRNLTRLISRLPDAADLYVVGGSIRNLMIDAIHGNAPPTCDIDIFIGGLPGDYPLAGDLIGLNVQMTELQGLRWHPDASAYAFDLCLLPRFVVIERFRLPANLESLLTGIDFSVNAIAYQVKTGAIFQRGCIEAVKRRVIDFNSSLVADRNIMIYRIMLIHHKTGFRFSRAVFNYLKHYLDLDTMNWLDGVNRGKLGKPDAAAIRKAYDAVGTTPSYQAWLTSYEANL